jgi:acetate kinase
MKILVLNSGSSSVKYRLFEMTNENCLAWGLVERTGSGGAILKHYRHDGHKVKLSAGVNDHAQAIKHILSILLSPNHGVLKEREDIAALGHRVVHGGEKFTESVLINEAVMDELRDCIELAPLHNPHNIRGINACMKVFSDRPHVAVFEQHFINRCH